MALTLHGTKANNTDLQPTESSIDLNGNELILDADADTSITADTDDVIDVKVGGNDNIEINALGSSRKLKIYKGGNDELVLQSNAPDAGNNMRKIELEGENVIFSTGSSGGTTTAERMKITTGETFVFGRDSASAMVIDLVDGTGDIILLRNGGSTKGTISTNGSTVSYNTSSDYRLKENVDYSFDATTRLKQLKPCRFNWIADDTNTLLDGFIAHEVSSIVPEAVNGEKDGAEMQGIDQSKLVPLLVKTIQEQQAVIENLQSRVTTLEG
jgi:hypothetical protein